MRYDSAGHFRPDVIEWFGLTASLLAGCAHIGLDVALAVLIGSGFRAYSPWAFMLAVSLAGCWTIAVAHLLVAVARLLRLMNASYESLRNRSRAPVLPLALDGGIGAFASCLFLGATVWLTSAARRNRADTADAARFQQFDIYFPLAIGFQILSLPAFVRLADMFGYARAKALRELDRVAEGGSKLKLRQGDLATGSTNTGSLISAESLRAAQRELDSARARHERQDRREKNKLVSVSTGGSAQSVRPQSPVLIPMVSPRQQLRDRAQSEGGRSPASGRQRAFSGPRQPEALTAQAVPEETRIEIFGNGPDQR